MPDFTHFYDTVTRHGCPECLNFLGLVGTLLVLLLAILPLFQIYYLNEKHAPSPFIQLGIHLKTYLEIH
jgi:hypothetical protein